MMFDINKNYWLYVSPYVYCCIKCTEALLYNTKNGAYFETRHTEVIALLQRLHEKKNLGAVCCKGEMLMEPCYRDFISALWQKELGDIVDVACMQEKPIQMMPVLNLQCDVDKLHKVEDRDRGEEVLSYLTELNIHLNTACDQHCIYCKEYARQCFCCQTKKDKPLQTLNVSVLKHVLSQIQHAAVGRLNLLGGDIFNYSDYDKLSTLLSSFKGQVHIWSHYGNFTKASLLYSDYIYNVIVPFPINAVLLNDAISSLGNLQVRFHFYVTQIEEYESAEALIEQYRISDFLIHPIYIETNRDFFEKYIYLSKEDILQSYSSFSQIFARQKMNSHFFGSLTVIANGDVFATVNSCSIGNILDNALIDIINKEMVVNTAWRKIRDNAPCSNCLYQYLCPSPSNYETVIGRQNLCHVMDELKLL